MLGRIFSQNCIWPSLRRIVTIFLLPLKLFIASDDICKHTEQQFVSKYHYRENIFLHRFTIFKKIIRALKSLSTIFNDTKIYKKIYTKKDLGKKKQKIEDFTISCEIVNKISKKDSNPQTR